LEEYLASHPELSWLHQIELRKFNRAADTLLSQAKPTSMLADKQMLLSLAKLAYFSEVNPETNLTLSQENALTEIDQHLALSEAQAWYERSLKGLDTQRANVSVTSTHMPVLTPEQLFQALSAYDEEEIKKQLSSSSSSSSSVSPSSSLVDVTPFVLSTEVLYHGQLMTSHHIIGLFHRLTQLTFQQQLSQLQDILERKSKDSSDAWMSLVEQLTIYQVWMSLHQKKCFDEEQLWFDSFMQAVTLDKNKYKMNEEIFSFIKEIPSLSKAHLQTAHEFNMLDHNNHHNQHIIQQNNVDSQSSNQMMDENNVD
jgi:hypothetical protein